MPEVPPEQNEKMDERRIRRGVSTDPTMQAGMPMGPTSSFEHGAKAEEARPMVALSMTIDEAQIVVGMLQERLHQDRRWGRGHDRRHTPTEWAAILSEQVGKFAQASTQTIDLGIAFDYKPSHANFEELERRATVIMAVSMAFLETMQAARR